MTQQSQHKFDNYYFFFLFLAKHKHPGEHEKVVHKCRPIRSCQPLLSWPNIAISTCALFMLLSTSERTRSHRETPISSSMQYSLYVCEARSSYLPITCPDVHLARFTDIKVINNEGKASLNS